MRFDAGAWPVQVVWGPGTPFVAPRIQPFAAPSWRHQLADGSMCLHPPEAAGGGYAGVVDIGWWLKRAREWLSRYRREGWHAELLPWALTQEQRPGPGYRKRVLPGLILALPPVWQAGPPGQSGRLEVRVPRDRLGLGAVVAWEGDGCAGRWPEGGLLVREGETLPGVWTCPWRPTLNRKDRRASERREEALRSRLNRHPDRPWLGLIWPPVAGLGITAWLQRGGEATPVGVTTLAEAHLGVRHRLGKEAPVIHSITQARVVLVGLGALGSEVAHLLAQEGVRQFLLVDGDALAPENCTRHRLDLADAGRTKVAAMRAAILRIRPTADVQMCETWLEDLLPTLSLTPGTLVIGATGAEESEHVLGDLAWNLRAPCLHAWMEHSGQVLRLHRAMPQRDPSLLELWTRTPCPVPVLPRLASTAAAAGCVNNVLPGSPLHLHAAANLVASVALDVIGGRSAAENHWLYAPSGCEDLGALIPDLSRRAGLWCAAVPFNSEGAPT